MQRIRWCKNFTGYHKERCDAGIDYEAVTPPGGSWADRPCVRNGSYDHDDGPTFPCALRVFRTVAEAKAEDAEVNAEVARKIALMFDGICPTCAKPYTPKEVGRCVYAQPCGHRLYQGKAALVKR